jgi:hypothetical protein
LQKERAQDMNESAAVLAEPEPEPEGIVRLKESYGELYPRLEKIREAYKRTDEHHLYQIFFLLAWHYSVANIIKVLEEFEKGVRESAIAQERVCGKWLGKRNKRDQENPNGRPVGMEG